MYRDICTVYITFFPVPGLMQAVLWVARQLTAHMTVWNSIHVSG